MRQRLKSEAATTDWGEVASVKAVYRQSHIDQPRSASYPPLSKDTNMAHSQCNHPHIGIGVILVNPAGQVLIGKREGSHAPYFSIPGGFLEPGETFEAAAIREVKEETGLDIANPVVVGVSNNLQTYKAEGLHVISVCLLAKEFSGNLTVMEPDKCSGWQWCEPTALPQPHFEASSIAIACYLEKKFYRQG